MIDPIPGYAPRRSFSRVTVKEIRLAQIDIPTLKRKYDLSDVEAHLLIYCGEQFIDQYGRVAE